jgi:hypothetical protein
MQVGLMSHRVKRADRRLVFIFIAFLLWSAKGLASVTSSEAQQMPGESRGWIRFNGWISPEATVNHGETFGDRSAALSGSKVVWILSPPDSWSKISSLSFWGRLGKGSIRSSQFAPESAFNFSFEEAAAGLSGATLTQGGEYYLIRLGGQRTEEDRRIGEAQWLALGHVAATWHLGEKTFFIYGGARSLAFGDPIVVPLFGVSHEFENGLRGSIVFPFTALLSGPNWHAFVRASGRRLHLGPENLLVHRVLAGGGLIFGGVPQAEAVLDAGLDAGRAVRISDGTKNLVDSGAATGFFMALQVTYRFGAESSEAGRGTSQGLSPLDAHLAEERAALNQTLPME